MIGAREGNLPFLANCIRLCTGLFLYTHDCAAKFNDGVASLVFVSTSANTHKRLLELKDNYNARCVTAIGGPLK